MPFNRNFFPFKTDFKLVFDLFKLLFIEFCLYIVSPLEINKNSDEFERKDEVNMEVKSGIKEETLADNQAKKLLKEQGPLDPKKDLSKYIFPNLNLLNEYIIYK